MILKMMSPFCFEVISQYFTWTINYYCVIVCHISWEHFCNITQGRRYGTILKLSFRVMHLFVIFLKTSQYRGEMEVILRNKEKEFIVTRTGQYGLPILSFFFKYGS